MMPDIWGRTVLFESRWFDFLGTLGSGLMACLKSGGGGKEWSEPEPAFFWTMLPNSKLPEKVFVGVLWGHIGQTRIWIIDAGWMRPEDLNNHFCLQKEQL
jgi:hypothetical protein